MKKLLTLLLLCSCLLSGCGEGASYQVPPPPESPHLYWKDVEMTVLEVSKYKSMNGQRREIYIILYSPDYGCSFDFEDTSIGLARRPMGWNYEAEDTVVAEVYSWVYDSTGEVEDRIINQIY